MIKPMVTGFCSVLRLMLHWAMGVGFENTCTILRKVKCLLGYSNTLWMAI